MLILSNLEPVDGRFRGGFLAVGNFDGVHLGHSALIERLRCAADARGARAIVLTFDPRPVDVLRPNQAPPPLTWTERKVDLLRQAGASYVCVFQTGRWLLGLTAREFFDRVVVRQFEARGMVEGPTFGFGRDRGGDSRLLAAWCAQAGLDFQLVDPMQLDGALVSTSRIREALAQGRAGDACRWLGRPHRIRGKVTLGTRRGAALGFPTANLIEVRNLLPAHGVYAGRAILEDDRQPLLAAIHVGPNATFGETIPSVEAHLLDFDADLYGRMIELEFVEYLRPTRPFESIEALVEQIGADVERTREVATTSRD